MKQSDKIKLKQEKLKQVKIQQKGYPICEQLNKYKC